MIKLAEQHAEISGSLERCGRASKDDVRIEHSNMIAKWAYPGLLDQINGQRAAFEDEVLDRLTSAFLAGGKEGCPGLVGHYEILLRQTDDYLRQATSK